MYKPLVYQPVSKVDKVNKIVVLLYPPGAGGEFLSFLLMAHDSTLWKQKPLCCFLPEYSSINNWFRNGSPFDIIHDANFKKRAGELVINISCDRKYLTELKEVKAKSIESKSIQALLDFDADDLWNQSLIKDILITEDKHTIIIDYFNPSENYNELCKLLKIKPDFHFYCWAWVGYLTWQKVFLKSDYSKNKLNNTIKHLKNHLPKGYNRWTYKNF